MTRGADLSSTLLQAAELRKLGDLTAALELLQPLVEQAPSNPRARISLAQTFIDAGQVDDARVQLEHVVETHPTNNRAALLLADSLVEDDPERATSIYHAILERSDAPAAAIGLAQLAQAQNQPGRAIVWLTEAVRRDPVDSRLQLRLAKALTSADRNTEAVERLTHMDDAALSLSERTTVGRLLIRAGEPAKGDPYIQDVLRTDPTEDVAIRLSAASGLDLHKLGLITAEALAERGRAAVQSGSPHETLTAGVRALARAGREGEAAEAAANALAIRYTSELARSAARVALRDSNPKRIRSIIEVAEKNEDHATASYIAGLLASQSERWNEALEHWSRYHTLTDDWQGRLERGHALTRLKRWDAAEREYRAVERATDTTKGVIGRIQLLSTRLESEGAADLATKALEASEHDSNLTQVAVGALCEASRFDEASSIIDRSSSLFNEHSIATLRAGYHRRRYEYDRAFELAMSVVDADSAGNELKRNALQLAAHTAIRMQPTQSVLERVLDAAMTTRPITVDVIELQAELLVALERFDEAKEVITGIHPQYRQRSTALRLRAWEAAQSGQHAEAQRLGARWLTRVYKPQVHAKIHGLNPMDSLNEVDPDEVVVLASVRDEALRIPDFVRHHRQLGVDRFIIVDNGSTDGTRDHLTGDDIILLHTSDDYVTAGLGMRWMNEIVARLATGTWCIFLDADEQLVFPGCETHCVQELTAYLDDFGYDACAGFMLDMHAATFEEQRSVREGDRLLDVCPWFTNDYRFQPLIESPYTTVRGGVREAQLGIKYREQTKSPFVKAGSGVQFLSSSHETTPARIADLSTVLLHFKFLGDSLERAAIEAGWTPFSYYSNRVRDHQQSIGASDNFSYMSDSAVRFRDSQQLIELGLMSSGEFMSGKDVLKK